MEFCTQHHYLYLNLNSATRGEHSERLVKDRTGVTKKFIPLLLSVVGRVCQMNNMARIKEDSFPDSLLYHEK